MKSDPCAVYPCAEPGCPNEAGPACGTYLYCHDHEHKEVIHMRKIREDEVTFSISIEQDDIPVRGNVMASGDDEADRKCEDEIIERLDRGDVWAWAIVCVTAALTLPDGSTVEGREYLSCCSYVDEKDFKQPGGYYDDMRHEALADLQRTIEEKITRDAQHAEWFK